MDQVLNVVTTGAILYTVAVGLLLIFGVMNVINLAHGAFLLLGAYSSLVVTNHGWNPWVSFALAPAVGMVTGAVVEVVLVRRLYAAPLDTILATWGLSIVITQAVILHWSQSVQFTNVPMRGTLDVFGVVYSKYRLFTVLIALGLLLVLVAVTRFTELGLTARAVIMNEPLARAMGINTTAVRLVTFSLGAGLASFAGAMLTPLFSVDPNMGLPWLVNAFMVVLVAGPSILGLALSALLLGGSQTLAAFYIKPTVGSLAILVLAVFILRFLPNGLGGVSLGRPSRLPRDRP
jgi:branched-chain amino acid transport system permease protein